MRLSAKGPDTTVSFTGRRLVAFLAAFAPGRRAARLRADEVEEDFRDAGALPFFKVYS